MTAYPELIHGRRDGFEQGAWSVELGSATRGGASCNLSERILRIPHGHDPTSRVVRAHELMHIRVSPYLSEHTPIDFELSPRALECAEEFRVNHLLHKLGFDVALLCDGTERLGGQRLAETNQWGEAVCFFLAVLGTGGELPFVKGVRSRQPSWPSAFRALKKRVGDVVMSMEPSRLGDTEINAEGFPGGFVEVTVVIAKLLSRSMGAAAPDSPDTLRVFRRSLEAGSRRAPSMAFAPLVFDQTLEYVTRRRRPLRRRSSPSITGTVMRYPSRLLTDPYQRAFTRRRGSGGGVVVIDQSGSMDVGIAEIDRMLSAAPDALIVGYSHRPGDQGTSPNAWILAQDGRVARVPRPGNIGNGVDGPVLRWAVGRVRRDEPIVWVTDGQVTDSHDHPCHRLSVECASLVMRHRIQLVATLGEVELALRGRKSTGGTFGRVGRELRRLRSGDCLTM